MHYTVQHKRNEDKDRRNSLLLTLLISLLIFLGIFFYKFTKITEKPEEVTTMLINFGDNREGAQIEEPANEEGSLATNNEAAETQPVIEEAKPIVKEKMITGTNPVTSVTKADKASPNKTQNKVTTSKKIPSKTTASKAAIPNSKTGNGDGKGNAAIGNLLKGRGTKPGTQGNKDTAGNLGDPLGGDGNGDSKIGIDRKLIGFIPGTMGRGGAQPANNCSASGTINVSYTVDKAGNVVSARRLSGVSDPCVVSSSVKWVKTYVKAERASTSSTGTYSITF